MAKLATLYVVFLAGAASLVFGQDLEKVREAERYHNLQTCLDGRYPVLCNHSLLRPDEARRVAEAEHRENLKTCLDGRYPVLCNHGLLQRSERAAVLEAERRENLKVCMDGRYPALCNHELLKSSGGVANGKSGVSTIPNLGSAPPSATSFDSALSEKTPVTRTGVGQRLPTTVYILLIYERDGLYTSTAVSELRAFQDLVAYVKRNWAAEFPSERVPQNEDQLVDAFFDHKGDKEGYEILELPLLK